MKHLINLCDHTTDEIRHVLAVGHQLRDDRDAGGNRPILAGKTLGMFFEKPSLRTRVSFEQGMYELGGNAIVLGQDEVGLGRRESVADFTRVVAGMVQGIMARVYSHAALEEMAELSDAPVINALSDYSHPCQALADAMTMQDEFGEDLAGRTLAFVGDGNNVARSLAMICEKLGMTFVHSGPADYQLTDCPAPVAAIADPHEAVNQADAIYADTFVSMGQEEEKAARLKTFELYQVNESLVGSAPDHAIVLHCLPAYRGVEITDAVMDGPQSRVFGQAHNRLHAQKGLLAVLLGEM